MNRLLPIIAASLAAVAIAFFSLRSATPSREPNDDDVIEQLRLAGSNLSKPHPIDFYIYVPSQESANRVAAALSPQGFQTKVEPSASGSGWLALASKQIVPSSSALAELRREFTFLAYKEHGDYDGWEAAVVK